MTQKKINIFFFKLLIVTIIIINLTIFFYFIENKHLSIIAILLRDNLHSIIFCLYFTKYQF